MLRRFCNVRTSSPAPTSTTTASATCATTSKFPALNHLPPDCREPAELPSPSFSVGVKSTRAPRNAGATPKSIPVKSEIATVNPSTRRSTPVAKPSGHA
jgi:hypothetical protein